MPEEINNRKVFTLTEVANSIKKLISGRYRSSYWIKAELNKLNHYSHSGHCYPDLMEKREGKITSQLRAILWKDDYRQINRRFKEVLHEPLKDGIKILFLAQIRFDPVHGLSLHIVDIDPSYTLGDLEREKLETIKKLTNEGLVARNRQQILPILPGRIAVVSVETSKGYADFLRVIDDNPWKYKFFHMLFPALLQGDKAVYSIISQLQRIQKVKAHFDLVAIIRGGGGDIGLSAYNKYELAKSIALFPLPVITGIGHATNETVVEMVAHQNEITPTKLAESLIHRYHDFSNLVRKAEESILRQGQKLIQSNRDQFNNLLQLMKLHASGMLNSHKSHLKDAGKAIRMYTHFITRNNRDYLIAEQQKRLHHQYNLTLQIQKSSLKSAKDLLFKESERLISENKKTLTESEKNTMQLHPENVLKRGYSITRIDGNAISNADQLKQDDLLETTFYDGRINSIVINNKIKDGK